MLRRYFRLQKRVLNLEDMALYMPSTSFRCYLATAIKAFERFESVPVNLEIKRLRIHDARYILDKICDDYPDTSKYVAQNAEIVLDKPFEKAAVKIQNGI